MATEELFSNANTLWVVHIGKDDRIAIRAHKEGFVCIGWTTMGDLSSYDTRNKMRAAMEQTWPNWKPKFGFCFLVPTVLRWPLHISF